MSLKINKELIRRSLLSSCLIISLIILFSSLLLPFVDQTINNQTLFNVLNVNMIFVAIFGYWNDNILLIQMSLITVSAVFFWLLICLTLVLFDRYPNVLIGFFYFGFNMITIELHNIIVV